MDTHKIGKGFLFVVIMLVLFYFNNGLTEIIAKPFLHTVETKQPETDYHEIAPIVPTFDRELQELADGVNKESPKMVDKITRLDSASAFALTKTFCYNYTVIGLDKTTINKGAIKNMERGMVKTFRENPEMKWFRDNKVTINYFYRDKSGSTLFDISITPEKYNL